MPWQNRFNSILNTFCLGIAIGRLIVGFLLLIQQYERAL